MCDSLFEFSRTQCAACHATFLFFFYRLPFEFWGLNRDDTDLHNTLIVSVLRGMIIGCDLIWVLSHLNN